MEIEFFYVSDIEQLEGNRFLIYNPSHKKNDDWFLEYAGMDEALHGGYTHEELKEAVSKGYARVVAEVETWD